MSSNGSSFILPKGSEYNDNKKDKHEKNVQNGYTYNATIVSDLCNNDFLLWILLCELVFLYTQPR